MQTSDRTYWLSCGPCVAPATGPLNLEPALAALPRAHGVVVDGGIEAEVIALDQVPHAGERRADLVVGRDLRFHAFFLLVKGQLKKRDETKKPSGALGYGVGSKWYLGRVAQSSSLATRWPVAC